MEKEFNLSDKTHWFYDGEGNEEDWYKDKDVKEFIKLDYDLINLLVTGTIDFREFMIRRNKLAGEKLI